MKTDRRTMLLAAGTAAVAAVAGAAPAQSPDIRGTVEFEGGAFIPKGQLAITVEDPALRDDPQHSAASMRVESDGGSRMMDFSLPQAGPASESAQVVARLERADGWLLARGSAPLEAGAPILVTLYTVMY